MTDLDKLATKISAVPTALVTKHMLQQVALSVKTKAAATMASFLGLTNVFVSQRLQVDTTTDGIRLGLAQRSALSSRYIASSTIVKSGKNRRPSLATALATNMPSISEQANTDLSTAIIAEFNNL